MWTNNVRQFNINPNWSVSQFVEVITPHLKRDFNMDSFDIVETGQDAPGIPAEAGIPLEMSNSIIKNKWRHKLEVSFYIRRKNYNYPQLENLDINLNLVQNIDTNESINPIILNSYIVDDCPICYTTRPLLTRYSCCHGLCNGCYWRCQLVDYNMCPICRQG